LTFHIFPHIYAPVLLIFHPFPKKNQAALLASKHSKRTGGDAGLFTLSESSWFRPVRTRSLPSNILARRRRRNGTETWRRRSCQCQHIRLNTHEKIWVNDDVPRRNGNVTYSVNQPLPVFKLLVADHYSRQPQTHIMSRTLPNSYKTWYTYVWQRSHSYYKYVILRMLM
jgi:hypothetical protein